MQQNNLKVQGTFLFCRKLCHRHKLDRILYYIIYSYQFLAFINLMQFRIIKEKIASYSNAKRDIAKPEIKQFYTYCKIGEKNQKDLQNL